MKILTQVAIYIFSAFVIFALVRYAKEWNIDNSVSNVLANSEQLKKDAISARPDLDPSLAFAEAARKKAEGELAATTSYEQKIKKAADQFFGYYFINVKTRNEYCANLGVDIRHLLLHSSGKIHKNMKSSFEKDQIKSTIRYY